MDTIKITQSGEGLVFTVELPDGHQYEVTMTEDYYQQLTGGQVDASTLIEKSFEFLLSKESPDQILRQFDLSVIASYFPEYEKIARGWGLETRK